MADRTDYRDPNVTTTKDSSSGGMPGWLKWVLIALAVIAVLWLVLALFDTDDEAGVVVPEADAVVVAPETGAIVDDTETELVPVVPTD